MAVTVVVGLHAPDVSQPPNRATEGSLTAMTTACLTTPLLTTHYYLPPSRGEIV